MKCTQRQAKFNCSLFISLTLKSTTKGSLTRRPYQQCVSNHVLACWFNMLTLGPDERWWRNKYEHHATATTVHLLFRTPWRLFPSLKFGHGQKPRPTGAIICSKPVAAIDALLLSRENAGSVDDDEWLENLRIGRRALKLVEESVAEFGERFELLRRINDQSVARNDLDEKRAGGWIHEIDRGTPNHRTN